MQNKIAQIRRLLLAGFLASILALTPIAVIAASNPFISQLTQLSSIASTVPANGDVNPYGVALITSSHGKLIRGNILVSNFNNSANLQGTGTTLVEVNPKGNVDLFSQIDPSKLPGNCPGGVGLTTALAVLPSGWVIVGSLPTTDGTAATAQAGCLIVLNSFGKPVETISGHGINGPWDMTARQDKNEAILFVSNVLNGTVAASPNVVNKGTVERIILIIPDERMGIPKVVAQTVIASGFPERTDPDALVIGPTGLGLSKNETLYVADTLDNQVTSIRNAVHRRTSSGTGKILTQGGNLNVPLGLVVAPNDDILVVNGGDGNLVDISPHGLQTMMTISSGGGGALFGLDIRSKPRGIFFVDDSNNTLNLLH